MKIKPLQGVSFVSLPIHMMAGAGLISFPLAFLYHGDIRLAALPFILLVPAIIYYLSYFIALTTGDNYDDDFHLCWHVHDHTHTEYGLLGNDSFFKCRCGSVIKTEYRFNFYGSLTHYYIKKPGDYCFKKI